MPKGYFEIRVSKDAPTECRCNTVHCQIIVRRPDSTCGKNIIVCTGEVPDLIGYEVQLIGNNGNLSNIDSEISQLMHQVGGVFIPCLSGKDLVTNNDDACGFGHLELTIACRN